jgi:hypothetical protein
VAVVVQVVVQVVARVAVQVDSRRQVRLRACMDSVEERHGLDQRHVRRVLAQLAMSIIRSACRRVSARVVINSKVRYHQYLSLLDDMKFRF